MALPWEYLWPSAAAYALGKTDRLLAENAEYVALSPEPECDRVPEKFGFIGEQAHLLLSCWTCEGRVSGIVDIPNACAPWHCRHQSLRKAS